MGIACYFSLFQFTFFVIIVCTLSSMCHLLVDICGVRTHKLCVRFEDASPLIFCNPNSEWEFVLRLFAPPLQASCFQFQFFTTPKHSYDILVVHKSLFREKRVSRLLPFTSHINPLYFTWLQQLILLARFTRRCRPTFYHLHNNASIIDRITWSWHLQLIPHY